MKVFAILLVITGFFSYFVDIFITVRKNDGLCVEVGTYSPKRIYIVEFGSVKIKEGKMNNWEKLEMEYLRQQVECLKERMRRDEIYTRIGTVMAFVFYILFLIMK